MPKSKPRVATTLHGGPFDGVICFPPDDAVELGLEQRSTGLVALYEIKGAWGSFIGMRPVESMERPGVNEVPWTVE